MYLNYSAGKKMNLNLSLKFYTKINSVWIMDLDMKCKNIKLLVKA